MNTEHLTEATEALNTATCCCETGEALDTLAQHLATDDTFVASLLAHLATDLDRTSQLVWDEAPELAKLLAQQDRG